MTFTLLSRILVRRPRMARAFTSPPSSHNRKRFTNYTYKHYFRLGLGCISITALSHQFFTKVYHVTPAEGPSMLPTFNLFGDWILIDMRCSLGRGVAVGDLVAYKIPIKRYQMGVKRIIGMPGDFVSTGTPGEDGEDATIQVSSQHPVIALHGMIYDTDNANCYINRFRLAIVGLWATI
ncbi:hypothetical protein NQ176_g1925 [Zarea fungicola]|uniref:Uncharacterized protein n=1 Tax=Zarea fungicola TaxID=93591 RepID=A0ACC1NQK1_9HYPO|nr:hypothetical protein NQ176_g1925 [Lecanicillium fungicola]